VFAVRVKHNERLAVLHFELADWTSGGVHFFVPFANFVVFIAVAGAWSSVTIAVSALPILGSRIDGPSSARR
jgi:hypothetical protein